MNTYIRFVVGAENEKANTLHGPFTESRILRDSGSLQDYEMEQLNSIYEWYNKNLPCPPFSTSKWPRNAVTWFRTDAQQFISRMYEIEAILKEHEISIRTLKTEFPGKILYEDSFQIVSVSVKY